MPSAGGGPAGGGPGPFPGWPGGPGGQGQGVPPGFPFPQRRGPAPARRGGCCATTLLRLLFLVLLIPVALFAIQYLLSAINGGDSPESAPVTTAPATSSTSSASRTSTSPGAGTTGTGTSSRASVTLAPTTGTTPVRLDATPCPAAAAPYPGLAVGPGTSCAFAADTRLAYVNSGASGQPQPVTLTVFSVAKGQNVTLSCTGQALVTCSSPEGAKVYLATGPLRIAG